MLDDIVTSTCQTPRCVLQHITKQGASCGEEQECKGPPSQPLQYAGTTSLWFNVIEKGSNLATWDMFIVISLPVCFLKNKWISLVHKRSVHAQFTVAGMFILTASCVNQWENSQRDYIIYNTMSLLWAAMLSSYFRIASTSQHVNQDHQFSPPCVISYWGLKGLAWQHPDWSFITSSFYNCCLVLQSAANTLVLSTKFQNICLTGNPGILFKHWNRGKLALSNYWWWQRVNQLLVHSLAEICGEPSHNGFCYS